MEISLFAKYHVIFCDKKIDNIAKNKLMKLYYLYDRNRKLWTEKNFTKLHLIADNYINKNKP